MSTDIYSVVSSYDFARVVAHSRVAAARRAVETGAPGLVLGGRGEGGMTRQQARSGATARTARGLAALVAGLTCMALLTPVAAASPIGDADNSITAAWKDAGGDNSDLGA